MLTLWIDWFDCWRGHKISELSKFYIIPAAYLHGTYGTSFENIILEVCKSVKNGVRKYVCSAFMSLILWSAIVRASFWARPHFMRYMCGRGHFLAGAAWWRNCLCSNWRVLFCFQRNGRWLFFTRDVRPTVGQSVQLRTLFSLLVDPRGRNIPSGGFEYFWLPSYRERETERMGDSQWIIISKYLGARNCACV